MRIISVKFQNLNSLKGVHEIRFDQSPFLESGLFAITGPTGAGKTTILDAITVALYGQVHRHDKNVEEIMSRHTAECYSEVEFEANGVLYRAKWSLRRSKRKVDGTIQPEKMELANAETGEFLGGHTTTSVKQLIKNICGLDYNQFLRSVILCQGDFTRFLKAGDNERSDLLEKITDTGIYSEISRFIFDKQKEEREKLELLNTTLAGVELLSEDEWRSYKIRLEDVDNQCKALRDKNSGNLLKISWLNNLYRLRSSRSSAVVDIDENKKLHAENKADFERVDLHKKASKFLPELTELNRLEQHLQKALADLDGLNSQLPDLISEHSNAFEILEQAKIANHTAQRQLSSLEPLFDEVLKIDAEITGAQEQIEKSLDRFKNTGLAANSILSEGTQKVIKLQEVQTEQKRLNDWLSINEKDKDLDKKILVFDQFYNELVRIDSTVNLTIEDQTNKNLLFKNASESFKKNSSDIEILTKKLESEQASLADLDAQMQDALSGRNLEDVELELSGLPLLINNCELQKKLAEAFKKNAAGQALLRHEVEVLHIDYKKQAGELSLINKELEEAEKNLADLRTLVELEQRIQKYDEDRKQLKPGEPCFLCGSVHHPFSDSNHKSELTASAQKRDEQILVVNQLSEQSKVRNIELSAFKIAIETKQIELERLQLEAKEVVEEFNQVNLLLPKSLDINAPEVIIAIIARKEHQAKQLQQVSLKVAAIKQNIVLTEKKVADSKEALVVAKGKTEALTERLNTLNEINEQLSVEIKNTTTQRDNIWQDIATLLAPYNITFSREQPELIKSTLTARFAAYTVASEKLQQNKMDYIELKTSLIDTVKSYKGILEELKLQENLLMQEQVKVSLLSAERNCLFSDKDVVMERNRLRLEMQSTQKLKDETQAQFSKKQELVALAEAKINELNAEARKTASLVEVGTTNLLDKLKKESIFSIAGLKALFVSEEDLKNISALQSKIETSIAASEQLLKNIETDLKIEQEKALTDETEETLRARSEEMESSISLLNQELGRLKEKIEEDDRLKLKFADITGRLQIQKKEFSKWNKLCDLIGSADGKKFRRFAQGLTLSRLTNLANRHLIKFSDRYRILKSKANDLELLIVDGYQADAIRPMATLSGGESFLVSLALALGLSDLASHKVQINSLFIDEGFGTLDADTLDIAISALESLQANGKSIGIISHVETLKERIGTQIQLSKQPGGSSKIRVMNYMNEVLGS